VIFGRARAKETAAPAWLVRLVVDGRVPERGEAGDAEWSDGLFFGDVPRPAEVVEAHRVELLAALGRAFPRASARALEGRLRVIAENPLHFPDELRGAK